ncbi:MAG: diguanylate cyclase [Polyangiales bacterium]
MPVEVLVIEDSEPDYRLAEVAIRTAFTDAEVVWATDLDEATVLANASDVIVLDLNLPKVSGLEGVERLSTEHPDKPLIVLTGRDADDPIALEALRLGAQDYLSKSESMQALGRSLRYALERHELVRELRAAKRALQERAEELARQASHDPLTGLANRRVLELALQAVPERARRNGLTAYGVLFDLDDFKSINAQHGLHGGDEVLKEVARTVRALVRPADVLARIGGDEFALLFTAERRSSAVVVVERVRKAIECAQPSVEVSVTASCALIAIGEAKSIAAFLERARGALETSKKTGKNCIAIREATGNIEVQASGAYASLIDPGCYTPEPWSVTERATGEKVAEWLQPVCHVEAGVLETLEVAALAAERNILDVVGEHFLTAHVAYASALELPTWFSVLPDTIGSIKRLNDLDPTLCAIHVEDSLLPVEESGFSAKLKRQCGGRSIILSTAVVGTRFFESMVHLEPSFIVYRADPALHAPQHHELQLARLVGVCDALGIRVCCQGLEPDDPILDRAGVRFHAEPPQL